MSDTVYTYKICVVEEVWDTEEVKPHENVEISVITANEEIYISRYKEKGQLIFTYAEWEAINNFIREELEANAETDS